MTHPYTNPMDVSEDEQRSMKQSVRDTNLSKSNSPSRMSTPSYGRLDQCVTSKTLHPQHRGLTEYEDTQPATPQGDTFRDRGMDERRYPKWYANDDVTMDLTAQRGR